MRISAGLGRSTHDQWLIICRSRTLVRAKTRRTTIWVRDLALVEVIVHIQSRQLVACYHSNRSLLHAVGPMSWLNNGHVSWLVQVLDLGGSWWRINAVIVDDTLKVEIISKLRLHIRLMSHKWLLELLVLVLIVHLRGLAVYQPYYWGPSVLLCLERYFEIIKYLIARVHLRPGHHRRPCFSCSAAGDVLISDRWRPMIH